MKEDNYKNREIDRMFDDVHEKLDKLLEGSEKIQEQTTKTNGRVNRHDVWFKVAWWILGAIVTIISLIVPLAIKVGKNYAHQEFSSLMEDYKSNE